MKADCSALSLQHELFRKGFGVLCLLYLAYSNCFFLVHFKKWCGEPTFCSGCSLFVEKYCDMEIKTGRGTIPLITVIGIWSISALNALPGLAVSPILGKMSVIFPHATDLDIEMLASLPSLMIIPFILLSGKLTEHIRNILLLRVGLVVFALSGVFYLLAGKMWQLIVISAMLGIGSGLVIPLSTGLITKFFQGKYRTQQFGLSSSITNLVMVGATVLTGYLAEIEWHLPFIVYLLPLVSLILTIPLGRSLDAEAHGASLASAAAAKAAAPAEERTSATFGKWGIDVSRLVWLMLFYGLVTYLAVIVALNVPFLMKSYGFESGDSGIVVSLFFLSIMAPGFVLPKIISICGNLTKFWSLVLFIIGFVLILISHSMLWISLGAIFVGLGYGVIQPAVYDQTSMVALPKKATLALAFVMSMNYIAILLCPFIIDLLQDIFHFHSVQSPFWINLVITVLAIGWAWWRRKEPLFEK